MFIYNLSLISFFWVFLTFFNHNFKTLHFFSGFTFLPYNVFLISILLFSMAGVPPFIGFFSKLFILLLITNNNYFFIYIFFFLLLLLGLYFYLQNIRFLHSTKSTFSVSNSSLPLMNERVDVLFYYSTLNTLVFLILGFIYVDDFLLITTWLFS